MRLPFVLTAALTVAGLATAQVHSLLGQEREDTTADRFEGRVVGPHDRVMTLVMNRRARLGIKVNLQARDTDSLGAYVESVTPNGPAAAAGLRSGDLITKVDGKSVLSGGVTGDRDTRQSLPGLRLIELAARLEPADTVAVEFLRGKDRRTVSLVTEDEPDMVMAGPGGGRPFVMRFRGDGPHDDPRMHVDDLMEMGPGSGSSSWPAPPSATSSWRPSTPIWVGTSAPLMGCWSSGPPRTAPWASRAVTWSRRSTAGSRPARPT